MAWLLATSPSQPVQLCVTSPTSLARSRATAESGSAATPVATEIAAATAAPARTGRRRSVSRRGGPAHDQHEHAELDRHLAEEDPALPAAEVLRPLDLRRAEVGSRLDRHRLGTPVAGPHQKDGGLRDDHRGDERDRQAP